MVPLRDDGAAPRRRDTTADELLVIRCQLGEHDAFEELIARWHTPLWKYLRRVAGEDDAAADCIQDVWLRVWRGIAGLREGGRLRPWLFGIARRVVGLSAWLVWNAQAYDVDDALLASDRLVHVLNGPDGMVFLPASDRAKAALIFLPGGTIDPEAYVPLVRHIAAAGHPAAIVPLPYRMAPTETSRGELWRRIGSTRKYWGAERPLVLAGHSRGAALAGGFAAQHAAALDGLALVGTTHPREVDLSRLTIPVLKVFGSRDCVAAPEAARANRARLPAHTQWIEIAGANHAQFGYYGRQLQDCTATITRDEQQRQLRQALLAFLERLRLHGASTLDVANHS